MPEPQMATTAGREEGPPPGRTSEQRVQAGLGAINHPPPTAGKEPGGLASAGPHPRGQQSQMLGKAGWEALQKGEAKHQIPELRVASRTQEQPNRGQAKATDVPPTLVGERRKGRERTIANWWGGVRTPPQDRGLRRQSLRPDGNQGCHFHLPGPSCLLAPGASVCWPSRRSLPSSLPAATQSRVACPQSKAQRQT